MAEAFLRKFGKDKFEVYSAGIKPGELNPLVVQIMKEIGIDIAQNKTKSVFEFYRQGRLFDYVITVCDQASQQCPIFPGTAKRINWSFPDPANFQGTIEEQLQKTRELRDAIKKKILNFISSLTNGY